jgi:hypothetical protein
VSRLSKKYGSLDVSHPYGPPRPVTEIALPLLLGFTASNDPSLLFCSNSSRFTVFRGLHGTSLDPVSPSGFMSQYRLLGPSLAIRKVSVVFLSSSKHMPRLKLTTVHEIFITRHSQFAFHNRPSIRCYIFRAGEKASIYIYLLFDCKWVLARWL